HAQYICSSESETMNFRHSARTANDDAGQNWHHGQHAGGKCQEEPETKKARHGKPEPSLEDARDTHVIGACGGPLDAEELGQRRIRGRSTRRGEPKQRLLLLRDIAHTDVRATLSHWRD